MKNIIILLMVSVVLSASVAQTEKKIYETILSSIFPNKDTIVVWSDNLKKQKIFAQMKNVKLVKNRDDADILILSKAYDIDTKNKKVFADGYLVFKHYKESIVGGFYWQKGRPNLVFIKKNLVDHNISLPNELREYIEDYD